MKRWLASLLAITILMGLIAQGTFAAELSDVKVGEVYYQQDDGLSSDDLVISRSETGYGSEGGKESFGIEGTKVATDLNSDNETTVTLSFPAPQEAVKYDIVLVGDMTASMSTNIESVKTLLDGLFTELVSKGAEVQVGAVGFGTSYYNKTAVGYKELLPLTKLTSAGDSTTFKNIIKSNMPYYLVESVLGIVGTNIQVGIQAGRGMLAADTTFAPDSNKYLILLTDGGAYMWNAPGNSATLDYDTDSTTQYNPLEQYSRYYNKSNAVTKQANEDGKLNPDVTIWASTPRFYGFDKWRTTQDNLGFNGNAAGATEPKDSPYMSQYAKTWYQQHKTTGFAHANGLAWYNANNIANNIYGLTTTDISGGADTANGQLGRSTLLRYRWYGQYHFIDANRSGDLYLAPVSTPSGTSADYYQQPDVAGMAEWYANFIAGEKTGLETTYPAAERTFAEYMNNTITAASLQTTVRANTPDDPYLGMEKATYWAAKELQEIKTSGEANIITIGYENYPKYATKEADDYKLNIAFADISVAFLRWTSTVGDYYGVDYWTSQTNSSQLKGVLDAISKSFIYTVEKGILRDTIGSEFNLTDTDANNAPDLGSVKLKLNTTELTKTVIDTETLGFESSANPYSANGYTAPDGSKCDYPYVLKYKSSTKSLTLTICVPVEADYPLALMYDLTLTKKSSPAGWHDNVELNTSAFLDFWKSGNNTTTPTGKVEFPVPLTRYVAFEVRYNFLKINSYYNNLEKASVLTDYPFDPLYKTDRTANTTIIPSSGWTYKGGSPIWPAPNWAATITGSGGSEKATFAAITSDGSSGYKFGTELLYIVEYDEEGEDDNEEYFYFQKYIYYKHNKDGSVINDSSGNPEKIEFSASQFGSLDFTGKVPWGDYTWFEAYPDGLDLFAEYTHNPYTVTFYPNGGTFDSSLVPNSDGSLGRVVLSPEDPGKWYTLVSSDKASGGTNIWPEINANNLIRKGYTLVLNGGEALWDISPNPSNPKNRLTKDTKIGHNWVVYAQWIPNKYTVYFEDEDGTPYNNLKLTDILWSDIVTMPAPPAKDGYDFVGWKLTDPNTGNIYVINDDELYSILVDDNDLKSSVTFTAIWKEKSKNTPTPDEKDDEQIGTDTDIPASDTDLPPKYPLPPVINPIPKPDNGDVQEVVKLFSEDHYAYIIGYPDGEVKPNNSITRAEVATVFFRMLTDEVRTANWTTSNSFSDVDKEDWYNNAVSVIAKMGIITGYPDGTFKPNQTITRAEVATIAARFARQMGLAATTQKAFNDVVGNWAEEDIAHAASVGWTNGYPDGTFKPGNSLTRAEFMTIVNRMLERAPETEPDIINTEQEAHPNEKWLRIWSDNSDVTAWYYLDVQEATNSHDYHRKDKMVPNLIFQYETWEVLLEIRDWAKFEKEWSTANSASNPSEILWIEN